MMSISLHPPFIIKKIDFKENVVSNVTKEGDTGDERCISNISPSFNNNGSFGESLNVDGWNYW